MAQAKTAATNEAMQTANGLGVDATPSPNQQPHACSIAELLILLDTDSHSGLGHDEATARLRHFGRNVLPSPPEAKTWQRFLAQFRNPLVYVLLASGALASLLGEFPDATAIFGVVFINAVVGFVQEHRAQKALQALRQYLRVDATVVRDGRKERIPAEELVPGDLVLLEPGDKVPADIRILSARELAIDESLLTGESVPVRKHAAAVDAAAALPDRTNMAFSGTLVVSGHGTGIAVCTGSNTELGRIHQLVSTTVGFETPLVRRIRVFSRVLTLAILALSGITFAVGLWRAQPLSEVILAAVALAVAVIPEGLPAAITVVLALGVSRMARRNAIIRRLPAVEALGSTTVICTDKTGTLTENQMTVTAVWAGGERFEVVGSGYDPDGLILAPNGVTPSFLPDPLLECLRAGVLCNDSRLEKRDGHWVVSGDPTEAALLVSARKAGMDPESMRHAYPRLDVLPFATEHQFMASLHRLPTGASVLYVKGAVEKVLGLSSAMLDANGKLIPVDGARILQAAETLAAEGLRVLAFARRVWPEALRSLHRVEVEKLVFLGLQGMHDPPRVEALGAVRSCLDAGVAVKMVTGDHPGTAAAIARKLRLTGSEDIAPVVATGAELSLARDDDLGDLVRRAHVFARVTAEQKLLIVRGLQAQNHIVALTGDGVNDAPALKQADIGIAMGSGTEVAKEAADIVLTDDNFRSLVAAVEEGRIAFDNLTKFLVWTMPTNFGEGLVLLAALALGTALPILPVQVLWVNLTTAICLGMTLAFEPKERDVMHRPPRDPRAPILTPLLVFRIVLVTILLLAGAFGVFAWEQSVGASIAEARTAAVNVVVMVELFYLFNCRSLKQSALTYGLFSNVWLNAGVAVMLGLQLAFTYVPALQYFFHSAGIPLESWIRAVAIGTVCAMVVEVEKRLWRPGATRIPRPR